MSMPIFKVVLLGNSGVGKSNLLSRLNSNEFSEEFLSTIGVEFLTKIIEVDGVKVKAQIWDTAGQERYNSMMGTYYRKAKGAVLVYDVSDRKSFEAIARWKKDSEDQGDPDLVMMLVGNKADLESQRQVSKQMGLDYAKQCSNDGNLMLFQETSAKSGLNVLTAFTELLKEIYKRKLGSDADCGWQNSMPPANSLGNLRQNQPQKKKGCC